MPQGIYAITCTINGKIYIGSSNDINRRWGEHRSLLKNGKHSNPHLQKCWNKYGSDYFIFSILEIVEDYTSLWDRELSQMKELSTLDKRKGFNVMHIQENGKRSTGCGNCYIITHPSGYTETTSDLGNICLQKGLTISAMHKVARGDGNHHKNFHIRLDGTSMDDWTKLRASKMVKGSRKNHKPKNTTGWIITSPEGTEFTVASLRKFCTEHGLSEGCMSSVGMGHRRQHKGYNCRPASN